ncbi:hypothetical protein ACW9UR_01825 [Halovulum sp. GXIMD14794]
MLKDQIFAMVAALLAGEPDATAFPQLAAAGADPRYEVSSAPCPRPVAPFEIEGRTITCGTVAVPLDHDAPGGQKIELLFAIYKSRSLAP